MKFRPIFHIQGLLLVFIGIFDPIENKRKKAIDMGEYEVFSPDSDELKLVIDDKPPQAE